MAKISELTDDELAVKLKRYKKKVKKNSEDEKAQKIYKKVKKEIKKRASSGEKEIELEFGLDLELEQAPAKLESPKKTTVDNTKTLPSSKKSSTGTSKKLPSGSTAKKLPPGIKNRFKDNKTMKVQVGSLEWGVARSGRRISARIIDFAVLCLVIGVLIIFLLSKQDVTALSQAVDKKDLSDPQLVFGIAIFIVLIVLPYLYEIVMLKVAGGTIGKLLLGLRVVPNFGSDKEISWFKAALRGIIVLVAGPQFIGILYSVAFFSPKRRQLADIFSGTRVIVKSGGSQEVKRKPLMAALLLVLTFAPFVIFAMVISGHILDGENKFNFNKGLWKKINGIVLTGDSHKKTVVNLEKTGSFSEAEKSKLKSMSAEAKLNLVALYSAESSFENNYGTYATCLVSMGLEKPENTSYYFGFPMKNSATDSKETIEKKTLDLCRNDRVHFFSPTSSDKIDHTEKFIALVKQVEAKVSRVKIGVRDNGMRFTAIAVREIRQPNGKIVIDAWTINYKKKIKHIINAIKVINEND